MLTGRTSLCSVVRLFLLFIPNYWVDKSFNSFGTTDVEEQDKSKVKHNILDKEKPRDSGQDNTCIEMQNKSGAKCL